jgi:hypothetical protein
MTDRVSVAQAKTAINEISVEEMKTLTIIGIARLAHEVNRAYCQSIGDDSQPAWKMLQIGRRRAQSMVSLII